MSDVIIRAVIFSCIAFSIVFIVLGGLTLVIFAMRLLTGGGEPEPAASKAAAKPAVSIPSAAPVPVAAANVKAQHVAAITAAILTMTQGRGRVVNITPAGGAWNTTQRWRAMSIVEGSGRALAPSWKR
ncbi:MAG: OadG family protein [Synergistaceae bacterium]|jgi:Na+-transporting methylmalonyl-CoA/oxaloacetate decarboxylase gamma subunit|nr:OadG family protein [Synergistaceae bacterium]